MKKTILFAALLLAAVAPLWGQDFIRQNDTLWTRQFVHKDGVVTDYAYKLDQSALIAQLNNDMRSAALCQAGCVVTGAAATLEAILYAKNPSGFRKGAAIVFGVASFGLGIASICKLYQKRVYVSPEGVIIRIGHTDKPKYDNRKRGIFSKREAEK